MDPKDQKTLEEDLAEMTDEEIDRRITAGLNDEPASDKVKVLECPDCGRSDLSYVAGMETGHQYQCPHCQYQGALAVERWRTPDELRSQSGQ